MRNAKRFTVVLAGTATLAVTASSTTPALAAAGGAETAPEAKVSAVWVPREAKFAYFGITSFYNCDGLRDLVRHVMLQVGARPDDLRVRVTCVETGGQGVETMPMVRVEASLPVVATPEVLAQLRDDPKRELVSRVRGEGEPEDPASTQFAAERRVVTFDGRRDRRVDDGDCELLQQLVRNVLVPMGVREVEGSRLNCAPRAVTVGAVNLRLETLQKAPES